MILTVENGDIPDFGADGIGVSGTSTTYSQNNVGGLTGMTTSKDSQSTSITYDARRRRSVTNCPTTANVVTTYTYDGKKQGRKRAAMCVGLSALARSID